MDLLVQDGWLPSYNIAAVLLQIRMAISSTEPRPARLASGSEWKRAYGTQEALDGKFISPTKAFEAILNFYHRVHPRCYDTWVACTGWNETISHAIDFEERGVPRFVS